MHPGISDCQKRRDFCLRSLVTFFVSYFGDLTNVILQVQSGIIALLSFLESNIKCPAVFNSPTKCSYFKVSSLQLGFHDVCLNHSADFSLQIEKREKKRQTASKGAMRIFTPLFEVVIKVQGVLNWKQNNNNNKKTLIFLAQQVRDLVYRWWQNVYSFYSSLKSLSHL